MRYFLAILCALAVVVTQGLYGGAMRPVFALPGLMLVGLAGVVALLGITWKGLPSPSVPGVLSVAALAGWLVWRCVESPDQWLASGYLRLVVGCFVLYLIFACAVTNPFHRLTFLGILLAAALAQAALAALQFARPTETGSLLPWLSEQLRVWYAWRWNARGHGTFLNGNHLVWFLNVAALFALAAACWGRWGLKTRIVLFYAALSLMVGALLTLSRGGYLGLGAGLAIFLILSSVALAIGSRDRRLVTALGILGGLVAMGSVLFWVMKESFIVQVRFDSVLSDTYRIQILETVLRQFQLEPIWGTGPGTFLYFGRQFRAQWSVNDDIFGHNDWAQLAADFGAPAVLLAALVVVLHLRSGFSGLLLVLRRRMAEQSRPQSHAAAIAIGALAVIGTFSVHSFFDFNMQIPANALLAAACLGMAANSGVKSSEFSGSLLEGFRGLGCVVAAIAGGVLMKLTFVAAWPEWCWLRAENALLSGRGEEALEAAGEATHPALPLVRGEVFLWSAFASSAPVEKRRLAARAAAALREAIAQNPREARSYLLLAEAELLRGNTAAARGAALESIRRSPLQGRPYVIIGDAHRADGQLLAAREAYLVAVPLPGTAGAQQAVFDVERSMRILADPQPPPF